MLPGVAGPASATLTGGKPSSRPDQLHPFGRPCHLECSHYTFYFFTLLYSTRIRPSPCLDLKPSGRSPPNARQKVKASPSTLLMPLSGFVSSGTMKVMSN